MTRKQYDKIVDVFCMVSPSINLRREDNWDEYQNDEPKDLIVELSVRLGAAVMRGESDIEGGEGNPFSDRDSLSKFSPEELN